MKIHGIASGYGNRFATYCGVEIFATKVKNEYETAACVRLECAPMNDTRTVDCLRCRKAIDSTPKGNPSAAYFAGLG